MPSATFFVLAALAVATAASPRKVFPIQPSVDYGNANYYIDLVLFNVNRNLPDTLPIPDIGGPFDMTNCFVIGLDYGIHRDGDATMVVVGNEVRFSSPFKMQNLGIRCDWHYLLMRGEASGITPYVSISSGMTLVMAHGEHPWLTEFLVMTLDPIQTDITGLTIAFNWLAEDMADWIINGFDDQITYVIEHEVRDEIQSILDTMVIP